VGNSDESLRILKYCNKNLRYCNGNLYWTASPSPRVNVGDKAGHSSSSNSYLNIQILCKKYLTHRVIFLMNHGYMPEQVDHINRDRKDNRIENLRGCDIHENLCNQGLRSNNTSGCKGVYFNKIEKTWLASISHKGVREHLGSFKNIKDAIYARQESEKRQGRFAAK